VSSNLTVSIPGSSEKIQYGPKASGSGHRHLSVQDVDTPHVMAILEPIWKTKTETAVRLRGRLETILDWATVRGYRAGLNPARWKGHLSVMLPAPGKVANAGHHRALPYAEMPEFMARLRGVEGESAQALQFAILTAARSGEVRGATWQEIDVDAKTWTVPAERMKAKKPHRVPLSEPALRLLRSRPRGKAGDVIFASSRDGAQLSNMAMLATVRRMQVDAVPHGLARATFKTWATECNSFPREVVEMALAHTLENKTEEAYWHGDLFEKRVSAMRAWAEFLNQPSRAASATPIHK
jgi:integrase